jgi:signal transduction histidine kinase/DNA-binding response OmpR family regulator
MKVLHVEDDPFDADLAIRTMRKLAPHIELDTITTVREAITRLEQNAFYYDLVLTDIHLPDGNGITLLKYIREKKIPLAIVVITGLGDAETAMAALKAGADDYLTKRDDYLERLPNTIENALIRYHNEKIKRIRPLRALYAVGRTDDLNMVRSYLKQHAANIDLEVVKSSSELISQLNRGGLENRYGVLLLDYYLPGLNALEQMKELYDTHKIDLPIVIIANEGDEGSVLQAVKLGAADYIVRTPGYHHHLPLVLENAFYRYELSREQFSLKIREQQQTFIAQLGQAALSNIDLSTLMDDATSMLSIALGGEYTTMLKPLSEDGKQLLLVAGDGWQEGLVGHMTVDVVPGSQEAYVLGTQAPVIIENLRTESRFSGTPFLHAFGVVSGASVIVGNVNDPLGILGIYTRKEHVFTRDEINFLQSIAHILASAIKRKMVEQERDQMFVDEHEARTRAEDLSRAKDEFIAILSHELRTPLTSILGWVHLINSGKLDGRLMSKGLETIERNTKRQIQLVNDLLDVSRIITGKLDLNSSRIDLKTIVYSAMERIHPLIEAKRLHAFVNVGQVDQYVFGDPDRLEQILDNLLSNAVKFTPEDGQIEIKLENEGEKARIIVSDTGIGIPKDFLPNIFDSFTQADSSTTRSYSGLGLGLALANHLTKLHGGTIQAKSEGLGKGATFTIELPLATTGVRGEQLSSAPSRPTSRYVSSHCETLKDLNILVVDDDSDTLKMLEVILQSCEAKVMVATSVAEAVDVLKHERPDVLLSDIGMANEDGYVLINKVKSIEQERNWKIPAAALTAYVSPEDKTKTLQSGYQMHISKPVSPEKLVQAVAMLAGRS